MNRICEKLLQTAYGLTVRRVERLEGGAGGDSFLAVCTEGSFVAKCGDGLVISHPEQEVELCDHLCGKGLPVCRFIRTAEGINIARGENGRYWWVRPYHEGTVRDFWQAPEWLLPQAAELLGRIHDALAELPALSVGIGPTFFDAMTPQNAAVSYARSLQRARELGDEEMQQDLLYRIDLMERMPERTFRLRDMTCLNSHGDYTIRQLVCGEESITAVIDWTSACIHPAVWELLRFFVYAHPACKDGSIPADQLLPYLESYRRRYPLRRADWQNMVPLLFHQLAVCDYAGQYYGSSSAGRELFRLQALFSTRLLRWLEQHGDALSDRIRSAFD